VAPVDRNHGKAAWTVLAALALVGLACTSAPRPEVRGHVSSAHEACFDARLIDSFSPLGDRFVYLRDLRGGQYLLTLDSMYTSLPNATGIRLLSSFGRVCSDSGARITYRSFSSPIVCRIIRVEQVASEDEARRLVEGRSSARHRR
jgi:hypothetical protein